MTQSDVKKKSQAEHLRVRPGSSYKENAGMMVGCVSYLRWRPQNQKGRIERHASKKGKDRLRRLICRRNINQEKQKYKIQREAYESAQSNECEI